MLCLNDKTRRAVYILMGLLHDGRVAKHSCTTHISQEELTYRVSYLILVCVLTQVFVSDENWDAEKGDAAKHHAERQ
jgi:hypothetical protein